MRGYQNLAMWALGKLCRQAAGVNEGRNFIPHFTEQERSWMQACYGGVAQAYNNRMGNCLRFGLGAARLREAETLTAPIQVVHTTETKYSLNLIRTYSWAKSMRWLWRAFSTEWMKARLNLRGVCRFARSTFRDFRQDVAGLWAGETAPITDQWIWPPGRQLVVNLRRRLR